jgi:hypothetical protein
VNGFGLPKSSRVAAVSALNGFHSATGRNQLGSVLVGTNAFETNVSGKTIRKPSCWPTSTDGTSRPIRTPIQAIAKVKKSIRATARRKSPTFVCTRQPTMRPESISTTRMPVL